MVTLLTLTLDPNQADALSINEVNLNSCLITTNINICNLVLTLPVMDELDCMSVPESRAITLSMLLA